MEMNLRTEFSCEFKELYSQISYKFPLVTISDIIKRFKFKLNKNNKKTIQLKDFMENIFWGKTCLIL